MEAKFTEIDEKTQREITKKLIRLIEEEKSNCDPYYRTDLNFYALGVEYHTELFIQCITQSYDEGDYMTPPSGTFSYDVRVNPVYYLEEATGNPIYPELDYEHIINTTK